jgi:hypothetical protein
MQIDFAKMAELIFSHREKELQIPDLPHTSYIHPGVLFFGQWTGQQWFSDDELLEPSSEQFCDGEFQTSLYEALEQGLTCAVDLVDCAPSIYQLMACDALYGIMLQHDAALERPERAFNVGKLELLVGEFHESATLTEFIGHGIIKTLAPIMGERFMQTNSVYAKLYAIVETELSFFLPISNAFLTRVCEEDIHKYDSFCNYDTHWGGLLGWYRLECIMRCLNPDFELSFSQEDRKALEDIVQDKLMKFRCLYDIVENILSRSGKETFEQTLAFYENIYAAH